VYPRSGIVVVLYARRSDENNSREILSPATPRSSFGLDLGGQRRRYPGNSARAQHHSFIILCREFVFLLSEENCTMVPVGTKIINSR